MFKKVLLMYLVLFGLLFSQMASECFADAASELQQAQAYQKNGDYEQAETIYQDIIMNYPGTDYAFKAQSNLVIVYILMKKDSQAQEALGKLQSDFAGHQDMPISLFSIARRYALADKHDNARSLYQQVIQQYPDNSEAEKARLYLAKMNIEPLIEEWDEATAIVAIDKFSADFVGHPHLPRLLYSLARIYEKPAKKYERPGRYERAKNIYQQIIQQHPDSLHASKAQFAAARTNVLCLIESGNYTAAQSAFNQLTTDFAGHSRLAAAMYNIAREFEDSGRYEQAKSIYQQIIQQYPDSTQAVKSQVGVPGTDILSLIESGNESGAQTAFYQLIADFSGHSNLSSMVFRVAKLYYKKALELEVQGLAEQARGYFQKAAAKWEMVMNELPVANHIPHACYYAVECYRKLGQYEKMIPCYQKVVDDYPEYFMAWDALFQVGYGYEKLQKSGAISKSEADTRTKAAYQQLLEDYPDCKAARHARRWLSQHSSK